MLMCLQLQQLAAMKVMKQNQLNNKIILRVDVREEEIEKVRVLNYDHGSRLIESMGSSDSLMFLIKNYFKVKTADSYG